MTAVDIQYNFIQQKLRINDEMYDLIMESLDKIMDRICEVFKIDKGGVKGTTRITKYAEARMAFCYKASVSLPGISNEDIADYLNQYDRTSVYSSIKKVKLIKMRDRKDRDSQEFIGKLEMI